MEQDTRTDLWSKQGRVVSVSRHGSHQFSKTPSESIRLLAGLGVEGDAHCGATVKHRSRVRQNPNQPNFRQVHVLHTELFTELAQQGYDITPAQLGENITTRGLLLLDLPAGTRLMLGAQAEIELTGLRNPCIQIDEFRPGLLQAVLGRRPDGALVRKAGVMAVVLQSGTVRPGDAIQIQLPAGPHRPLERI